METEVLAYECKNCGFKDFAISGFYNGISYSPFICLKCKKLITLIDKLKLTSSQAVCPNCKFELVNFHSSEEANVLKKSDGKLICPNCGKPEFETMSLKICYDKNPRISRGSIEVGDLTGRTIQYDVFVIKERSKIPAKLIQYHEKQKLILKFQNEKYEVSFYSNWFKTLRELDEIVNKNGLKILCNGTSKYTGVLGLIVTMGDGSACYYKDPKEKNVKKKPQEVPTLGYNYWNDYATEKEQRISFFGKEFAKLIEKGRDYVHKEIEKSKKEREK